MTSSSKTVKVKKAITTRVLIDSSGKMVGDAPLSELRSWMLLHANQYVDVTIEECRNPRNLSQNAYVHAIFGYFAEWSGDTPENTKKVMKEMWVPTGNIIIHAKGKPWQWEEIETEETHLMDKERMSWFIDRVYNTMCEQGFVPPTPEQVLLDRKTKGRK